MGEFDLSVLAVKLFRGLQVVLALGSIILIHEFGHFIVAKWSRMRVEEFSVGIGPVLRRWERGGTVYKLCAFLFMGYVKIAGLEGGLESQADEGNFYRRPHYQRVATIIAGALVNIVVAALLFCLLYGLWGVPDVRTFVGGVRPGSPAEQAGLEAGWRIVSADGAPVEAPEDIQAAVGESDGRPVRIGLWRDDERREAVVRPAWNAEERVWRAGIDLADDAAMTPRIARVEPGGAAAEAGLARGDVIVAVNGRGAAEVYDLLEPLVAVPEELELQRAEEVTLPSVALTVRRGAEVLEVSLRPRPEKSLRPEPPKEGEPDGLDDVDRPVQEYLVGDPGLVLERRYRRLSAAAAVTEGMAKGGGALMSVVESFGFLVQGRGLHQIGGPVMIVKSLSTSAFLGPYALLEWAGILSIMIGAFNLLPLPALDGGRLVFILLEWLFGRPPLQWTVHWRRSLVPVTLERDSVPEHARLREAMVHSVGLLMLLGLILLISVRDYMRYLT